MRLTIFCPKCMAEHNLDIDGDMPLDQHFECGECRHMFTVVEAYDKIHLTSPEKHGIAALNKYSQELADTIESINTRHLKNSLYKLDVNSKLFNDLLKRKSDLLVICGVCEDRMKFLESVNRQRHEEYERSREILKEIEGIGDLENRRRELVNAYTKFDDLPDQFMTKKEREAKSTIYSAIMQVIHRIDELDEYDQIMLRECKDIYEAI